MGIKLPPLPTLADLTRLRAHDGPMTRELLLRPGQHGLGMTHAGMNASATVTMPCGYCSTGCGLRMHLDDDGRAVGLTPETSYPVNLGMACPKGWEALRVLEMQRDTMETALRARPDVENGALSLSLSAREDRQRTEEHVDREIADASETNDPADETAPSQQPRADVI